MQWGQVSSHWKVLQSLLATSAGATMIGFLAQGASPVARAMNEKVGDFGVSVADFGPAGGGADDTAEVQAAFDSGAETIWITGEYTVDTITVPSSVRYIYGPGKLIQRTKDTENILEGTGLSDVVIYGVLFDGGSAGDFNVEAFNNAIYLTSCNNVHVLSCGFENVDNQTVYARTSTNIYCDHLTGDTCSAGIRFNGVQGGAISNCIYKNGAVTDGTFTTCISLNSRAVAGGGQNRDVKISNTHVSGYKNAQSFLVHDGTGIQIEGCSSNDATWGLGCNPTDATDEVVDITILGFHHTGAASVLGSETGEYGIFVGAATGTTKNVTILGGIIKGANAVWKHQYEGGIGIGGSENVKVGWVTIEGAYSNGIAVNQANAVDFELQFNTIDTVNAGDSSASCGIVVNAAANTCSGWARWNTIKTASDGVRCNNSQFPGFQAGENAFTGVTTKYQGVGNMVFGDGYQAPYTDGDTTPSVKNAKTLRIANTGTTTITDFDDGEEGQEVTLVFDDANTTLTDGSTLRLGSTFNSTAWDAMKIKKIGSSWVECGARSVN